MREPILKGRCEGEPLKYGENPNQKGWVDIPKGVEIYVKNPGFINWLDVSRAYMCATEASGVLNMPVATSYKHTSIAGIGYTLPNFNETEEQVFTQGKGLRKFLDGGHKLSPQARAYLKATWCDRQASFGEVVGLSDILDYSTAIAMKGKQVDAIVCRGFEHDALEMVLKKREIPIIVITNEFRPPDMIKRTTDLGVKLDQERNDLAYSDSLFLNRDSVDVGDLYGVIVTHYLNKDITDQQKQDILLTAAGVKYSESNNVGIGYRGCALNCAGGQKRVLSSRVAAEKWTDFALLQHPEVLELEGKGFTDALHKKIMYIRNMDGRKKRDFLFEKFIDSVGVSDAFFPFPDAPQELLDVGVSLLVQPGGSKRDQDIIDLVNLHDTKMIFARIKKEGSERWEDDLMARLFAHS